MSDDRLRPDVVARVVAGPERGHFIKLKDDSEVSGGVLIITSSDPAFERDGWDVWVAGWAEVTSFFDANGWQVEWPG